MKTDSKFHGSTSALVLQAHVLAPKKNEKAHLPLRLYDIALSYIRQNLMNHSLVHFREDEIVTSLTFSSNILPPSIFHLMNNFHTAPRLIKDDILFDIIQAAKKCKDLKKQKNPDIIKPSSKTAYNIKFLDCIIQFIYLFDIKYFEKVFDSIQYLFRVTKNDVGLRQLRTKLSMCNETTNYFFTDWNSSRFKNLTPKEYATFIGIKNGTKLLKDSYFFTVESPTINHNPREEEDFFDDSDFSDNSDYDIPIVLTVDNEVDDL